MTTYPAAMAELDQLRAKHQLAQQLADELVAIVDKLHDANRVLQVELDTVKRRLAYAEMERDTYRAKASL